jgi:hypothetical protein
MELEAGYESGRSTESSASEEARLRPRQPSRRSPASSRRQHRRTRSSSSSRSRSYAAGWPSPDADVRHRQRESRPDQRRASAARGRSAAGPTVGPVAAPRTAAGGGEINLPRGAHFLSAVREPAFSRTFPRYCAACRCRPAAPQLGRRLDYVDDPTFNAGSADEFRSESTCAFRSASRTLVERILDAIRSESL